MDFYAFYSETNNPIIKEMYFLSFRFQAYIEKSYSNLDPVAGVGTVVSSERNRDMCDI